MKLNALRVSAGTLLAGALIWLAVPMARPQIRPPIITDPVMELRQAVLQLTTRTLNLETKVAEQSAANAVLRKDVEALKVKVKVLEETVKKPAAERSGGTPPSGGGG